MTDVNEFVDNFLAHEYDPVKAREYYLRTRQLKGRKKASAKPINPRSKVGYNGKPLKKLGTRMEEDETPDVSPSGAKLKDYNGKGLGRATYADGSVYDAAKGWTTKYKANIANIDKTDKANTPVKRRIGAAEQKLIRAKSLAMKVKDPKRKAVLLQRLSATERKLKAVSARNKTPRRGLQE